MTPPRNPSAQKPSAKYPETNSGNGSTESSFSGIKIFVKGDSDFPGWARGVFPAPGSCRSEDCDPRRQAHSLFQVTSYRTKPSHDPESLRNRFLCYMEQVCLWGFPVPQERAHSKTKTPCHGRDQGNPGPSEFPFNVVTQGSLSRLKTQAARPLEGARSPCDVQGKFLPLRLERANATEAPCPTPKSLHVHTRSRAKSKVEQAANKWLPGQRLSIKWTKLRAGSNRTKVESDLWVQWRSHSKVSQALGSHKRLALQGPQPTNPKKGLDHGM